MIALYSSLFEQLRQSGQASWAAALEKSLGAALQPEAHGLMPTWRGGIDALPALFPSFVELQNKIAVGIDTDCDATTRAELERILHLFRPWRKGPFDLYGIHLDCEWRSDWKWDRFAKAIAPLNGRRILDVGCGNGYYGWRMAGAGARMVVGIDPFHLYVMQYLLLRHLIGPTSNYVLPTGVEDIPAELRWFDTTFSMGVLYHRRSPFDHLFQLRDTLRPGGELVLETIVIDGAEGHVLVPHGRYAQMRNVWFLPSALTLEAWLRRCRFQDIRLVDVTPTTTAEQRATPWMVFHSLADFLDPADPGKTIEGYPAPQRAIFVATAPS